MLTARSYTRKTLGILPEVTAARSYTCENNYLDTVLVRLPLHPQRTVTKKSTLGRHGNTENKIVEPSAERFFVGGGVKMLQNVPK